MTTSISLSVDTRVLSEEYQSVIRRDRVTNDDPSDPGLKLKAISKTHKAF